MVYVVLYFVVCHMKERFVYHEFRVRTALPSNVVLADEVFCLRDSSSHGIKSGEYGGKNVIKAPLAFKASTTSWV
jgi:hypothetical protein